MVWGGLHHVPWYFSAWIIGEASNANEGFRTAVGALGEGVYLTRSLEKTKGYMPGGAAKQTCGKAKKGVVVKAKVHLAPSTRQRRYG
jgi:hypothetical protein